MPRQNFVYPAVCERVIDGDTYVMRIDLGFQVSVTLPVRLRGVNTPEVVGAERQAGLDAKTYAATVIQGLPVTVRSYLDRQSFARWVCDVWTAGGASLADLIIENGYGEKM